MPNKILVIDNFDSFTYNLVDYLQRLGSHCEIFRNNVPMRVFTQNNYQAVVLSPGPATPRQAGNLMEIIEYYHKKLPILGICLGHQAIGEFFGATLTHAHKPMHGKLSEIITQPSLLFKDLPSSFKVVRYHSLILKNPASNLKTIATTHDQHQEIMALEHSHLPIFGVQFHPEAILCEYGLEILQNWLEIVQLYNQS